MNPGMDDMEFIVEEGLREYTTRETREIVEELRKHITKYLEIRNRIKEEVKQENGELDKLHLLPTWKMEILVAYSRHRWAYHTCNLMRAIAKTRLIKIAELQNIMLKLGYDELKKYITDMSELSVSFS